MMRRVRNAGPADPDDEEQLIETDAEKTQEHQQIACPARVQTGISASYLCQRYTPIISMPAMIMRTPDSEQRRELAQGVLARRRNSMTKAWSSAVIRL